MADADFARPFGYADEHDIHNANAADDQADRCDPREQKRERLLRAGNDVEELGSAGDREVVVGARAQAVLPTLTGIMTSRSSDGDARRLAVLDGRICTEGEQLGNLTVMRIARGGVSLVKGDQAWFLKAPDIAYSLTTQ